VELPLLCVAAAAGPGAAAASVINVCRSGIARETLFVSWRPCRWRKIFQLLSTLAGQVGAAKGWAVVAAP
jgi:hypothetical protein